MLFQLEERRLIIVSRSLGADCENPSEGGEPYEFHLYLTEFSAHLLELLRPAEEERGKCPRDRGRSVRRPGAAAEELSHRVLQGGQPDGLRPGVPRGGLFLLPLFKNIKNKIYFANFYEYYPKISFIIKIW